MAGRKPLGKKAMTPAEHQARYRARLKKEQKSLKARVNKLDRRSRPQRWADAVDELKALQQEYSEWLMMLPDSLQGSRTAEMLQEIEALDLDSIAEIELPQGFGRDF
jgi:hypothetical protein